MVLLLEDRRADVEQRGARGAPEAVAVEEDAVRRVAIDQHQRLRADTAGGAADRRRRALPGDKHTQTSENQ